MSIVGADPPLRPHLCGAGEHPIGVLIGAFGFGFQQWIMFSH